MRIGTLPSCQRTTGPQKQSTLKSVIGSRPDWFSEIENACSGKGKECHRSKTNFASTTVASAEVDAFFFHPQTWC